MESTSQQNASKNRAFMNTFRHGLTGQTILMPAVDIEPYKAFCKRAFDELKPRGPLKEITVQTIADSSWRLNRVRIDNSSLFPQDGEYPQINSELSKSLTKLNTYDLTGLQKSAATPKQECSKKLRPSLSY